MRQRLPYVNECRSAPLLHGVWLGVSSQEGLRRRKARELEQDLRTAALELFERKGFEATSVEDIAAAVNVSARTVFRHFPRKDDLVMVASGEELRVVCQNLRQRPRGEPHLKALRAAISQYAADLERRKEEVMRGIGVIDASPSLQRRQAEELGVWTDGLVAEIAQRDGVGEPMLDHLATVLTAMSAFSAAYREWVSGSREPLPSLFNRTFQAIEDQVAALSSAEASRPDPRAHASPQASGASEA